MIRLNLSPSQLSVFRDCPQKYAYRYLQKRTTRADDPKLRFGRAWDDATGAWWEGGITAAVEWLVSQAGKLDPVDAAKIAALLTHYAPPRDRFEFIGNQVAKEIRPEGLHGVRVLCIADTLLRDRQTGDLVVRECKTTSSQIEGFGPYWQRLQVDGQVGAYWHAFGASVIFYDVIYKPAIRCCGTDEKAAGEGATREQVIDAYQARVEAQLVDNPQKFYQWRPIYKTDDDAAKAMSDIVEQARMLRESWRHGLWPRNSNHCVNRYGVCPYLDVCSGRADIHDESLFMDYSRRVA